MIEPYYESESAVIYHGNADDILPTLSRASVDLIVTDPPYGVGYQSNWGKNFDPIHGDDGLFDPMLTIGRALDVLRPFRHLYVFGPGDLTKLPVTEPVELIWDKGQMGMGDLSSPWGVSHERIQFAVLVPSKANRKDGRGRLSARLRQGSVLRFDRPNSRGVSRHPTEKPVALLRQIVESSSVLGDLVCDPFMGSGSTLVAAALEGRRALGIELDERYCQVAAERLRHVEAILAQVGAA